MNLSSRSFRENKCITKKTIAQLTQAELSLHYNKLLKDCLREMHNVQNYDSNLKVIRLGLQLYMSELYLNKLMQNNKQNQMILRRALLQTSLTFYFHHFIHYGIHLQCVTLPNQVCMQFHTACYL